MNRYRDAGWLALVLLLASCRDDAIRLPPEAPEARAAVWSPDGQWLAYELADSAEPADLYVSRLDGTQRRLLVPGGLEPDWSPDGLSIAFSSGQRIGRVEIANGVVTWLTDTGAAIGPAWSPDGATIAFSWNAGNNNNPPDLWLIPAGGGTPSRIGLPGPPRDETSFADWAPDNLRLVATVMATTHRLLVTRLDGTDTLLMMHGGANAGSAAWSPLGNRIVYVKAMPGQPGDLWLVNPDGSGDRLLVRNAFSPEWSPDGQRIVFSRRSQTEVAIWSVDTTAGNERLLISPR